MTTPQTRTEVLAEKQQLEEQQLSQQEQQQHVQIQEVQLIHQLIHTGA
jgi:hypothetical protein